MSEHDTQKVYVIQHELGPVKIGIAENPRKRLGDLQVSSPFELKVRQTATVTNAQAVERYLHTRFAGYYIRGEWFDLPPELRDFDIPTNIDSRTGKPNTEIETPDERNINKEWADLFERVFRVWESIKYHSPESHDIEDVVDTTFSPYGYNRHEIEEKDEYTGDVTTAEMHETSETGKQLCTRCGHSFSRNELACPTCDGEAGNDLDAGGRSYY